jgi:hypothetical protein
MWYESKPFPKNNMKTDTGLSPDLASLHDTAINLLTRWAEAAEALWHTDPGNPDSGYFGSGYQTWGIQSNWNYAGTLATLAARFPEKPLFQKRARQALRYVMDTHITGTRPGNEGRPWGNTWISMLGIERAMNGIMYLLPTLQEADQQALQRLLVSEADWLLNPIHGNTPGILAGKWNQSGQNQPESNIWSGSLLWRVAEMFPDEPHVDAWREQAHLFLLNGVSVEADAGDSRRIAGKPVSDRHIGANFFPNYALDHHGYLNVGYMALCVSNVAILHFDAKLTGFQVPESLHHHQSDLWKVLRRMLFEDGRLARIGGDSRVRYAYCQEYLLPSLLYAADHLQDSHALSLGRGFLDLMVKEAEGGSGLFYEKRLGDMRRQNPHYYGRLESDRACVLAMLLTYLPLVNIPPAPTHPHAESVAGEWMEEEHGAVLHRSQHRFASFAWRSFGLTQALCLPPDASDMMEWAENLCPVVHCLGDDRKHPGGHRRLLTHHLETFEGGFVTYGSVMEGTELRADEGANCTDQAKTQLAFAALPDGQTCLGLQYVKTAADRVVYVSELKDLHLVIPNDVFNGNQRRLRTADGETLLYSPPKHDEVLTFEGRWANFDDRVGVMLLYGADQLRVDRCTNRRAGKYRSLFTEELCVRVLNAATHCPPDTLLSDLGFAVISGATADETAQTQGTVLSFSAPGLRGVSVEGADNLLYALVANFGKDTQSTEIFGKSVELPAGTAALRIQ